MKKEEERRIERGMKKEKERKRVKMERERERREWHIMGKRRKKKGRGK